LLAECPTEGRYVRRSDEVSGQLTATGVDRWYGRLWHALRGAVRSSSRHGVSQLAAAISFRVLFSLVPLVALAVAVVDLVLPAGRREEVIDWIIETLSGSTGLEESVRREVTQGATTASVAGLVALVGLIWAASGMMGAIRKAFATIWQEAPREPYLHGKLVDLTVVLGAGIAAILGFGLGIVVDALSEAGTGIGAAIGVEGADRWVGAAAARAATLLLIFVCFCALYRIVPPVVPRWAALWPGAAVGAVSFKVATTAYGAYLARFGDLSVVYGSLGAVLGFLLVVWAGSIAMLFGAEIVAGWPEPRSATAVA
jgi:membrane protein